MLIKGLATLLFSMLVITALPAPALAATGFPKGTFVLKAGNKCVEYGTKPNETVLALYLAPCSTRYKAAQVWQMTDGSVRLAGQLRNIGSSTRCAYTNSYGFGPMTCLAKGSSSEKEYMHTVTPSKNIKAGALCVSANVGAANCATKKNDDGEVRTLLKFTFPKPPAR